ARPRRPGGGGGADRGVGRAPVRLGRGARLGDAVRRRPGRAQPGRRHDRPRPRDRPRGGVPGAAPARGGGRRAVPPPRPQPAAGRDVPRDRPGGRAGAHRVRRPRGRAPAMRRAARPRDRAFRRDRLTLTLDGAFVTWGWFLYAFGPIVPEIAREQDVSFALAGLHGTAMA